MGDVYSFSLYDAPKICMRTSVTVNLSCSSNSKFDSTSNFNETDAFILEVCYSDHG